MMKSLPVESFLIPGADARLRYERDEKGRLVRLTCRGRTYLKVEDDVRILGDGLASVREVTVPAGIVRHVRTAGRSWTEKYLLDDRGRPASIDGVTVRRDELGRVTACQGGGVNWFYGYAGDSLAVIEGPGGVRHLTHDSRGRPVKVRENGSATTFSYDEGGQLTPAPTLPSGWRRDMLGRLWTIKDNRGRILFTYLWDGMSCLGRIDGSPGEPLAAAFSLDPSLTPVRVITQHGFTAIPRDAFGEGLLEHEGIPGLFGGAVHDGFVLLSARALNPRTGAFDRPDPWHGESGDPRRKDGYRGPLTVEKARAGSYAVCRNDAVGFTDPTGEISIPLILSDLTWSLPNNQMGWLGMDLTLNFWLSLLISPFQAMAGTDETFIEHFFSYSGLVSSDRLGSFGVRRDGLFADHNPNPRAYSVQHIIWSEKQEFDELKDVRVLDPRQAFRPTLYGTLLRVDPVDADPFILRGTRAPGGVSTTDDAEGWSRCGGPAEPVIPGSPVPHFPSGGLHFDEGAHAGLSGPRDARLAELDVAGPLGWGTLTQRAVLTVTATGLGLSADGFVLLSDGSGRLLATKVLSALESGGRTRIRVADDASVMGSGDIRLRGLDGPLSTEPVRHGSAPETTQLDTSGTTATYTQGDVLRLEKGGSFQTAIVEHLEARVLVDEALPADLSAPFKVRQGNALRPSVPGSAVRLNDPAVNDVLDFTGSPNAPVRGTALVLQKGGSRLTVVIVEEIAGTEQRRVDRDLGSLASPGDSLDWWVMDRGTELGDSEAPGSGAGVTYKPDAVRTAPTSGYLWVEGTPDDPARPGLAVRTITGAAYDALSLSANGLGPLTGEYQVERFLTEAPDRIGLSIEREQALSLQPGVDISGHALQVQKLSAPTVAGAAGGVLFSNVTLTGASWTVTIPSGTVPSSQPTPAQAVILNDGSNPPELVAVKAIHAVTTFQSTLSVAETGLEMVPLRNGSPLYSALRRGDFEITVLPEVAGDRVEMPEFSKGELVEVGWTGLNPFLLYRVSDADGTTLSLAGDQKIASTIPAGNPVPGLTIRRLVPDDPETGGSRCGLLGEPVGGVPAGDKVETTQIRFAVWNPDTPLRLDRVAVIDGDDVWPARVDSGAAVALTFEFDSSPGLAGPVDMAAPNVAATDYAADYTQEQSAVTIRSALPNVAGAGSADDLVIAMPFREATEPHRLAASGQLSAGTLLVPEEHGVYEVDRCQSLTDHELTHTLQYARWGQWMTSFFPVGALEGIIELASDAELPEFSPYVSGDIELEEGTGRRLLNIPDFGGVEFEEGSSVQIASASRAAVMRELGQRDGQRFEIGGDGGISPGPVSVRMQTSGPGWIVDAAQFLTIGGLLNFVTGNTYGGLFWCFGKLFYALGRLIGGKGDNHPATVEQEGRVLRLEDPEGREALRGASRVIVQSGDATVVRQTGETEEGEEREEGVLYLASSVEFEGSVRVAPYSTHTPDSAWDWNDYFPARVSDPLRPCSIEVFPADGESLELHPHDRVVVTVDTRSMKTNVTAVNGNQVELEDEPFNSGDLRELRIAKIGENDPMGNADSYLMGEMGMGWLRWILDPYGQLNYRTHPEPGSFWDVISRMGRYILGSQSWSILVPGYMLWFILVDQIKGTGHFSPAEQEASEESGDLYSALARLRENLSVVGDVSRYWCWPWWDENRIGTVVESGRQDAPGVHLKEHPLALPSFSNTGTPGSEPNQGARALAGSGDQVPDSFFQKDDTAPLDPLSPGTFGPDSFPPDYRGWLPTSPVLERCSGAYMAFCRPGRHRVTVQDSNTTAAQEARETQDEEMQTLFFDVDVADVTVRISGQVVQEGDTVTLVHMQRASVAVTPGAERKYAVRLLQPQNGDTLRLDGSGAMIAQSSDNSEPVDIARIYRYDQGSDSWDAGVLNHHGMNRKGDLQITVRRFFVDVVHELPFRAARSLNAAVLDAGNPLLPGQDAFLLVPASMTGPLTRGAVTYSGGSHPSDPSPDIVPESTPASLAEFIGGGGVIRIRCRDVDPPEEEAAMAFHIDVGQPGDTSTLDAVLHYHPHFRLVAGGGSAADYRVARGSSLALQCVDASGGAVNPDSNVSVVPDEDITTSVSGSTVTIDVAGSAATGPRRVLVKDSSDASKMAKRTIEITA